MSAAGQAWEAHASTCEKCKQVVIEKPATLALACIEGARLFKDLSNEQYLALSAEQRAKAGYV